MLGGDWSVSNLKILHDIREWVILHEAVFILPVSPAALDERELVLIDMIMDRVDI
jgi:hypothetical protein